MGDDPNVTVAVVSGIATVIVAVITLVGVIISNRRTVGKVSEAKDAAELAAARVEPVSNGFAASVQQKLDTLVSNDIALSGRMNTLADNHSALTNHVMRLGERQTSLEGQIIGMQMQLPIGKQV